MSYSRTVTKQAKLMNMTYHYAWNAYYGSIDFSAFEGHRACRLIDHQPTMLYSSAFKGEQIPEAYVAMRSRLPSIGRA